MLRRSLSLALALAFAVPAVSFAKDPAPVPPCPADAERCTMAADPGTSTTAPAGRSFFVAAIERSGQTIKVEGKLWIEGDQLGASAGCNSIRASATFDGRTLRLRDIVTTEMACDDRLAAAERALLAALSAGPFTWDGSGFAGAGVRIVATDMAAVPAQPPDAPARDPNVPVGKPVDPGVVEPDPGLDLEACRKLIPEKEWSAVFGPATGGAGAGSGNASSGSGGGTSGAGGGTNGSGGREVVPPPVQILPAPPVPPDTTGTTVVGPAVASDGPIAVDPPAVAADGGPRRLPAATTDRPVPSPSTASCRELLARIRTMAAPAAASAGGGKATTEAARDLTADGAASAALDPAAATLLVLAGGALIVLWLRAVPGRARSL